MRWTRKSAVLFSSTTTITQKQEWNVTRLLHQECHGADDACNTRSSGHVKMSSTTGLCRRRTRSIPRTGRPIARLPSFGAWRLRSAGSRRCSGSGGEQLVGGERPAIG